MVCLRETTKAFTVPRICIKLVGNGAFGVANKVSLLSQEVSSKGCYQQGCNEVRWRPEQEASLAPPCSSLRSFGSIMYCFEKRTGDIFGTSRRPPQWFGVSRSDSAPHNNSAPGELCPPWPPRYAPGYHSVNRIDELAQSVSRRNHCGCSCYSYKTAALNERVRPWLNEPVFNGENTFKRQSTDDVKH